MLELLAATTEVSGEGSIIIPTAVITSLSTLLLTLGTLWLKNKSKVTVDGEVNVTNKVQSSAVVSWVEVRDLRKRLDKTEEHIDDLRKTMADQFKTLLESGSERESRLSAKVEGVAKEMAKRTDSVGRRIDDFMKTMIEKSNTSKK